MPTRSWPFPACALPAAAAALILAGCGGGANNSAEVTNAATVTVAAPLAAPPAASSGPSTPGAVANPGGRVFYVDSKAGSDGNSGLDPSPSAGGQGPWRSLAKLAAVTLQPGDIIRLVCGSRWNETLHLADSGTDTHPIVVTAYPAGCADAPAIDGAVALPPAAWTAHSGSIFKTPLPVAPLQMHADGGTMTAAHHPNRGFDASQPDSLYLRVAADADRSTLDGRTVSTTLSTGSDLVLPAAASLEPGITVRVRSASWMIDESTVSAVSGMRLTLATPTSYPLAAGWGYYLLGALWMLDSPGEWHHDAATGTLYAWMPDSRPPSTTVWATTLATGIDLQSREYVSIDGLAVRRVGVGVNARGSRGVVVRASRIEDTAGIGIDAAASAGFVASANVVARTGRDAISGVDDSAGTATDMQVLGNTITDSAVLIAGDAVASLPVRSYAAIRVGEHGIVSGNSVANAAYNGIWALRESTIADNLVTGACTVLDDCGGIYASGAGNGSTMRGNLLLDARGAAAGKPPGSAATQAQGIYLDESASGIVVQGNTASGNDNGIQLHVAANNTLAGNKLYGNRRGQLWLQETRNRDNAAGDVFGNTVSGNQIVSTDAGAKAVRLDTLYADTQHFGRFDANRYYDRLFAIVVDEHAAAASSTYTLPQWKAATTAAGVSRANEPNGWGASMAPFAPSLVNGSNIVPNGDLAGGTTGWSHWSPALPNGTLSRTACAAGHCLRYAAGGSPGIVSSPNFSIAGGTWYRLSVDVLAGAPAQAVDLVVRGGGGGSNGYQSLADRPLKFVTGTAWSRYSVVFEATATINVDDPRTGDLGARVDFQNIVPGQTLSIANLELVAITPAEATNRADLLLNTGSTPLALACPLAAARPSMCANYLRLSDNQPVIWPHVLPARSSEIVYTLEPSLVDNDGDGIADSQDACPNTPPGQGVNSRGCALGQ